MVRSSPNPAPLPSRTTGRHGFALLITITLLAFLVLLLVSLATLTRVETQVASNNQQLSQARQNALMALNIAVGQLQKYAGPDQRITARADVLTSYTDSPAPPGNASGDNAADFNTFWGTRNRYWTGVWGNKETNISYGLSPHEITGRGVTPELINWLVSGNESASFTLEGTNGGVKAGTGTAEPSFIPNKTVSNLAAGTGITVKNKSDGDKPAVLLVGPNSTGGLTGDYVVAPLVDITAAPSAIPGADATSSTPVKIGSYAWWVGDEGIKARVNLQNGYLKTSLPSDRINSFITAQRSAIELMDRNSTGTAIGADFDFTSGKIPSISTPAQTAFLSPSSTTLATAVKNRFHDITAQSFGVLADSYAGGLKKDLTADIADTATTASGTRKADADPIFTPEVGTAEANLPTWGHLRSWVRTNPDSSGVRAPVPANNTSAGFSPMIVLASIGLDVYIDAGKTVRAALFPVVILSNPYPVTIAASRYDLGFKFPVNSNMLLQVSPPTNPLDWKTAGVFDWGSPEIRAVVPSITPPALPPAGTESNFIRFTIDGSVIPPGESHIYRLNSSGANYAPGVILTRAPASSNINLTNHVMVSSNFTLDPSVVTMPTTNPDGTTTTDTSYFFRVHLENMARGSNKPSVSSVDVVFAREGDLNNQAGWYQAYNMIVSSSGAGAGQLQVIKISLAPTTTPATPLDLTNPEHSSALRIANNWNQLTGGARAAIRMGSTFEGRGDYQAADRFGMTQSPRAWLRHGNMRAMNTRANLVDGTMFPGNKAIIGSAVMGIVLTNDLPTNRDVAIFSAYNQYAAGASGSLDFTNSSRYLTLFDILDSPDRLLSLGQLQNVPFSRYGFQPTYPFGNSMGDMRIPRTATYRSNMVIRPGTTATQDPGYDLSWHLNRSLWDRTFVSGVPSTWSQADINSDKSLPNARMIPYKRDGSTLNLDELRFTGGANKAYDKAAKHLMVAGSFNINSTSEQAWRAILGGSAGIPTDSTYSETGDFINEIIPYPRISHKLSHAANSPYTGITDTMVIKQMTTAATVPFSNLLYNGNRGLYLKSQQPTNTTNSSAAAVVNELSRTIVREIRRRGPFLSLGDFVNRIPTSGDSGIKGALQTAIDTMSTAQANPFTAWNDAYGPNGTAFQSVSLNTANYTAYSAYDKELYIGGPESEVGTGRDAFRFMNAFTPKYLTQADLLSSLGPILSARSDTFTIRTYGETVNPVTLVSEGRAWCEAIVQRIPDYVTSSDDAEKHPTDSTLTTASKTFGRKFKIVSFRWLSSSDI